MDGWQGSEAWRADPRAEYILSEAGGRSRRGCGVGREDARIFISKIFSQKIWPKNWGGSSNGGFRERHVCGSGSAPPRPPFRADEKHPGVFLSAGIPAARGY